MSNNNKRFLAIGLGMCLAGQALAGPGPAGYEEPYEEKISIMGETSRAVFGRVFGVKGEGADVRYHVIEFTEHKPLSAGIRSALIPGWGQAFNGQRRKGMIFLLAFSATAGGSYALHQSAQEDHHDYEARGAKDGSLYDDYERKYTQSVLLGGAAVVFWVASVLDARREALHPVFSKEMSIDFVMQDDTSQLRWRKRF